MPKYKYDVRQRLFIYDSYVRTGSARAVSRLFQDAFPDVQVPNQSTIYRLVNKFRETGSVLDKKFKRARTVLTEETLDKVGRALETSPGKPFRRLAQEIGISYGSLLTAMKLLQELGRLRKNLRKCDDNDEGDNMDAVVQQIIMNPPEVIIKEEPVVKEEAECDPGDVGAGAQQDFEYVSVKEEPIEHPDESTSPAPEEVVASTKFESDSERLIQKSSESCCISSVETVKQEVVPSNLVIGAGASTHFTMFSIHTQQTDEEDSLFGIRLKCSLREKDFQKFSCSFCLQSFPSKYRLIMHVFTHIDGVEPPTYVCKSCGEVFLTSINLSKHLIMNKDVQASFDWHNDKFDCIYNNENVIVEGDPEVAFIEQTEKQSPEMEPRNSSTKSGDRHDDHGTSSPTGNANECAVVRTAVRPHKCDVCGKGFTQLIHLKSHSLIHAGIRPHTCNICGKSFTLLRNLRQHSLIHKGIRPYKCDVCAKSFTDPGSLKKHVLIHIGCKLYKCDICDKDFTHLRGLKRHSLIHNEAKQYKCDICEKSFLSLADLKRHARLHSGMRPHVCGICAKSFTRLDHLNLHTLTHTGLKPHKCDMCGRSFSRADALKAHSIIHKRKTPHKQNTLGN